MRMCKVVLTESEDPKIFDLENEEDLTMACYKIEILPQHKALAYFYARDTEGNLFEDASGGLACIKPVPIKIISGIW